jgi:hypothetical protein
LFVAAPALAAPRIVLLESHAGDAQPALDRPLATIAAAFSDEMLAGDDLRRALAAYSQRLRRSSSEDLQTLLRLVREGSAEYVATNFTAAASQLAAAIDGLAREPEALLESPRLRAARKEALVTLAQIHVKLRRTDEARAVLAEAVRSFPELAAFSASEFPPKVVELGRAILEQRAPGGTLVVETAPNSRAVAVNEQLVGGAPKTLRGLLPGRYRVFLPPAQPGQRGSLRTVEVSAGRTTVVHFDAELEEHLESDDFVGLRFASSDERRQLEATLACTVARALGADEVVVLTPDHSRLLGAIYDARSGHRIANSVLPLDAPPDAITRFAISLHARRALDAPQPPPPSLAARPAWRLSPREQIAVGTLIGAGLTSVAVGLGVHYGYGCDQWFSSSLALPTDLRCAGDSPPRAGFALALVGGALVGSGLVFTIASRIAHALRR